MNSHFQKVIFYKFTSFSIIALRPSVSFDPVAESGKQKPFFNPSSKLFEFKTYAETRANPAGKPAVQPAAATNEVTPI